MRKPSPIAKLAARAVPAVALTAVAGGTRRRGTIEHEEFDLVFETITITHVPNGATHEDHWAVAT